VLVWLIDNLGHLQTLFMLSNVHVCEVTVREQQTFMQSWHTYLEMLLFILLFIIPYVEPMFSSIICHPITPAVDG